MGLQVISSTVASGVHRTRKILLLFMFRGGPGNLENFCYLLQAANDNSSITAVSGNYRDGYSVLTGIQIALIFDVH